MMFLEKIRFADVVRLALTGESAFCGVKSLGARLAERLIGLAGRPAPARRIDFGDLDAATGIRGNAYRNAEKVLERLPGRHWADDLSLRLGIDFWLVLQKFCFDELYLRFEFIEMALRYAEEHPGEAQVIRVERQDLGAYVGELARRFDLRLSASLWWVEAASVFALPLFVEFYWRRHGAASELRHDRRLVCEVDGDKTLEMFSSLLGACGGRLAFVAERRNAGEFHPEQRVDALGLRPEGVRYLRRAAWQYIAASLRHCGAVARLGNRLFRIFYVLMQGRAEAIAGSGNTYFTYEHFVTVKAVRNEFLKAAGNRTVFVPLNAHVTPQYFHSEILMNYDIICSAGEHIETLYRRKRCLTQAFPPTGSYESHRRSTRSDQRETRLARLKAFKGDAVAITVISPGIADATAGIETKLMALARTLSGLPGVRVIIRMKPVAPIAKYARFYEEQTMGIRAILLTGGEYDLFDLFEVSDLFVTSISNAAFDLAQAGAQVMFIDYLKDPELQLCLSAVPGVQVPEADSLEAISSWVEDRGDARFRWREKMRKFSAHIAYRHRDFETYRRNFLAQLARLGVPLDGVTAVAKAA